MPAHQLFLQIPATRGWAASRDRVDEAPRLGRENAQAVPAEATNHGAAPGNGLKLLSRRHLRSPAVFWRVSHKTAGAGVRL